MRFFKGSLLLFCLIFSSPTPAMSGMFMPPMGGGNCSLAMQLAMQAGMGASTPQRIRQKEIQIAHLEQQIDDLNDKIEEEKSYISERIGEGGVDVADQITQFMEEKYNLKTADNQYCPKIGGGGGKSSGSRSSGGSGNSNCHCVMPPCNCDDWLNPNPPDSGGSGWFMDAPSELDFGEDDYSMNILLCPFNEPGCLLDLFIPSAYATYTPKQVNAQKKRLIDAFNQDTKHWNNRSELRELKSDTIHKIQQYKGKEIDEFARKLIKGIKPPAGASWTPRQWTKVAPMPELPERRKAAPATTRKPPISSTKTTIPGTVNKIDYKIKKNQSAFDAGKQNKKTLKQQIKPKAQLIRRQFTPLTKKQPSTSSKPNTLPPSPTINGLAKKIKSDITRSNTGRKTLESNIPSKPSGFERTPTAIDLDFGFDLGSDSTNTETGRAGDMQSAREDVSYASVELKSTNAAYKQSAQYTKQTLKGLKALTRTIKDRGKKQKLQQAIRNFSSRSKKSRTKGFNTLHQIITNLKDDELKPARLKDGGRVNAQIIKNQFKNFTEAVEAQKTAWDDLQDAKSENKRAGKSYVKTLKNYEKECRKTRGFHVSKTHQCRRTEECDTWLKWKGCARGSRRDGDSRRRRSRRRSRTTINASKICSNAHLCLAKNYEGKDNPVARLSTESSGSDRDCTTAMKNLAKFINKKEQLEDAIRKISDNLFDLETEYQIKTEAGDYCEGCERLEKIRDIINPRPSGWQILGGTLTALAGAAAGYFGMKHANDMRDRQGFGAQPGWALGLAYPFIQAGLYGSGLFGNPNSLACSPTMGGMGGMFGNIFGTPMWAMQQFQMMNMLGGGMFGGMPGMMGGMFGGMFGGMPGMMGGMFGGMFGGMPGMMGGMFGGGMFGGMPGMGGMFFQQMQQFQMMRMFSMGGMQMMGAMPGMMRYADDGSMQMHGYADDGGYVQVWVGMQMMGAMPGNMMGMQMMGAMPGMMGMQMMGAMPGNMMGMQMMGAMPGNMMGQWQAQMSQQQAWMAFQQQQMQNWMQRQQAASTLYQEIYRLQGQIQSILTSGGYGNVAFNQGGPMQPQPYNPGFFGGGGSEEFTGGRRVPRSDRSPR